MSSLLLKVTLRDYGIVLRSTTVPNAQEHLHTSFVKSALAGLSLGLMQMVVMNYVSKC